MNEPSPPRTYVMVVDDNPTNLKLLEDMLRQQGHEARLFPRGRLALAEVARNRPDLILLDIQMPEMNGYEVCERLKASEEHSDIPVIFLSALTETEDKVRAFRSGAVDYISKPFQFEEVQARVETHVKLHHLRRALKLQNERLEDAVAARTRELSDANERLSILDRSKDDFLHLISHELRTPLNVLLGVGEIILEEGRFENADNRLRWMFERSRQRILAMVDDALLLTEIGVYGGQFRSAPVSLNEVLNHAIDSASEFALPQSIAISPAPADVDFVVGNEKLLVRALEALLETAVKFSVRGETVELANEVTADLHSLTIDSHGKTIDNSAIPQFFDLLSVGEASTSGGDLGMGPALAKRILSLFGASVSVQNRDPCGTRLTISLRRAGPLEPAS
jgi:two-component system, sensor histidine kinase and response regulator